MATTDNAVQYDVLFVDFFAPYLGMTKAELKTTKKLAAMGIVQRERLVEVVTAKVSGSLEVVSVEGMDFNDGSDMKTAVSSMRNNDIRRGAWMNSFEIRKIATKTGDLRVVGYNKLLKKFHFFYIPRYAYEHLKTTLTIVIETATSHNGEPNFTGIPNRNLKFWEFECASFEEMCDAGPINLDEWELA